MFIHNLIKCIIIEFVNKVYALTMKAIYTFLILETTPYGKLI
jgi:hypothetical protein